MIFSLTTAVIKKLIKITRNKQKHNEIATLARSKLNSIEKLVFQALINLELNHEEEKPLLMKKKIIEDSKKILE